MGHSRWKPASRLPDCLRATGRALILCGARERLAAVTGQTQLHVYVGESDIYLNIDAAPGRTSEVHAGRAA